MVIRLKHFFTILILNRRCAKLNYETSTKNKKLPVNVAAFKGAFQYESLHDRINKISNKTMTLFYHTYSPMSNESFV